MTAQLHGVIPAAGIGLRMGASVPKQYLSLGGATLLEHSVNALLAVPGVKSVTVALDPADAVAGGLDLLRDARVNTVPGGKERADSVLAALQAVPGTSGDWVLVHDAARPCLRQADVRRLVAWVMSHGEGAILAEPLLDTVKLADASGRIEKTLDRSRLWRAQTPQMFRLGELIRALQAASAEGLPVTDEASAMELTGYAVNLVAGSPSNLKVTLPGDLDLAAWFMSRSGERQ